MRVTVQEKERRLELLGKFRPGKIGKELDHAARMLVDDSDSGEMLVDEIQRDKGEYEWIQNIAKWGYPPGWTTALSMPFLSPFFSPNTYHVYRSHRPSRADGEIYRPDRIPERPDIFT